MSAVQSELSSGHHAISAGSFKKIGFERYGESHVALVNTLLRRLAHCFHGRCDSTSRLVVVGATFGAIKISMLLFFACGFGINADAALS